MSKFFICNADITSEVRYEFNQELLNWTAASDACTRKGGRLAQIFNAVIQQKN